MARPNPKNHRAFLYAVPVVIAAMVLRQIDFRADDPLGLFCTILRASLYIVLFAAWHVKELYEKTGYNSRFTPVGAVIKDEVCEFCGLCEDRGMCEARCEDYHCEHGFCRPDPRLEYRDRIRSYRS